MNSGSKQLEEDLRIREHVEIVVRIRGDDVGKEGGGRLTTKGVDEVLRCKAVLGVNLL